MARRNILKKIGNALGQITMWLAFPVLVSAQGTGVQTPQQIHKAYNWYFGDKAGLDFSSGHPVAVTNGAMSSFEGAASMSDETGNLLFYSNGGSMPYAGGVWNRNHQLMPNGNMTGTGGCNSSLQSSLIVNQPRSKDVFYLFTTDCIENNSQGGLRYSVIDMNLDGGLGDVVVKDVQLTGPTDESMTAMKHGNGRDWWIVTHKIHTDSFYMYHLSPQGVVGLVKNKIGPVTPDYAGTIKVSTNGRKMVYTGLNWTYVYDVDYLTGELSNPVNLNTPGYSAAFSPNCQFVYVADGVGKNIYQFDLMTDDPRGSKTAVGSTASLGIGTMELGPDGRIYVARFTTSQYLGVINDPNYKGTAANYVDDGIYLNGKTCKGGLPNFPNSYIGGCTSYPDIDDSNTPVISAQAMNINAHAFNVSWNNTGNSAYRVMTRQLGTVEWNEQLVYNTDLELTDLTPETRYEVRIVPTDGLTMTEIYEPVYDHFIDDVIAMKGSEDATYISEKLVVETPSVLDFSMYPNPAVNSTRVNVNTGDKASDLTIRIMDIKGTVVSQQVYTYVQGVQQYDLPVSELSNGIYQVMMTSNNNTVAKKLVVMK